MGTFFSLENINCNMIINPKLNQYDKNIRFVDEIILEDTKYIIKKEYLENNISKEYEFYKNHQSLIIKNNFNYLINLPIKILNCKKSYIYIFNIIENNYNLQFIKNLNYNEWIDYTIQICLTIFYINHKLKIYHNDISKLRNVMIKNNDSNILIKILEFSYLINDNHIIIIDFGHASNVPDFTTSLIYKRNTKYSKYNYEFISEVFLIFYYSYVLYNLPNDPKIFENDNFDIENFTIFNSLYSLIITLMKENNDDKNIDYNLINFDKIILQLVLTLKNIK